MVPPPSHVPSSATASPPATPGAATPPTAGAPGAASPPAPGVIDSALRRLAGVMQARSCESQHADLAACLSAAHDKGSDAAAAAHECERYVSALHWCEAQLPLYGQQSNHFMV